MGGYLKKSQPQYFSLATGTARGDYNATTDRFINNNNKFLAYALNKPARDSWEFSLDQSSGVDMFYLNLEALKGNDYKDSLKFRLIGYGTQSSPEREYTKLSIEKLFDGLIFIKMTSAPRILD